MDLFDLQAKIALDVQEYVDGLNNAQKQTKSFGSRLQTGLATAAKVGAAAIGAVTLAAGAFTKGVIDGTKQVANYGDEVDKMSQKLGLSASAYQEWDYVLGQAGVEITSISTGLKTLTNQIDEAKNGSDDATARFAALGITLEDLATMSREDVFAAVVEGFQGMADSTERAALANDLFGRSGQELTPLFNATAEGTKELRDAAHELGFVLSDEAVKASADYKDSLDTLQRTLGGVKNNISAEFLPSITSVMNGLTDLFSGNQSSGISKINSGLTDFINNLSETVPKVMGIAAEIVPAIGNAIVNNLDSVVNAGSNIILRLSDSIIKGLPQFGKSVVQIIKTLATSVSKNIKPLLSAFTDALLEIVDLLTSPDTISDMVDAGIDLLMAIGEGLIEAVPRLLQSIPKIITNLADGFAKNAGKIAQAGISLMVSLGKSLISAIPELLKSIPEIIASIVGGLFEGVSEISKAFGNAILGAKDGSLEAAKAIRDQIDAMVDWSEAWNSIEPNLIDYNGLLSAQGKTISDINSDMSNAEQGINEILSAALSERRKLREDELAEIGIYLDKIQELENEKLSIYRSQQVAELNKIRLEAEAGGVTPANAAQMVANAEEAMKRANELAEEYYTQDLIRLENQFLLTPEMTEDEKRDARREAKKDRDDILRENQRVYNETVAIVTQKTGELVRVNTDGIGQALANMQKAEQELADAADEAVETWEEYDRLYKAQDVFNEAFANITNENTRAFLTMLSETRKYGGRLSDENRKIAATIFSAYENLPEDMQEAGKESLLAMAEGIISEIPELSDTSEMTAKEIVAAIREYLEFYDIEGLGEGVAKDLGKGIERGTSTAEEKARALGAAVYKRFTDLRDSAYGIGERAALLWAEGLAAGMNSSTTNRTFQTIDSYIAKLGYTAPARTTQQSEPPIMSVEYPNYQREVLDKLDKIAESAGGNVILDSGAIVGAVDDGLGINMNRHQRGN